ncbi:MULTISPECIES: maleate cis-trans isomerase family protein [unclassified Brevundimonas]|uniref:maleate cis-trans isomerase family protein n=1 Tax=unclassified Brevundimonas TaxID=2622653 RepID=UPI0025BF828E|nr:MULTISPECIES: hypothetical protein [unclassified Brevundimonas]
MNTGSPPIASPRPDLGASAVVALLTPAENPTAEPEISTLLPPDFNVLTARMYAPFGDMHERLRAYELQMSRWLEPFGDAPLDAVAFACTGSTYLLAPEQRCSDRILRGKGPCPLIGAANAVERALKALGARRIALVSPYPPALTQPATAYWASRGFEPDFVLQAPPSKVAGHPIYTQTSSDLLAVLETAVRQRGIDAVVATGTGAPSLPALAVASLRADMPILSSNLATAWALCQDLGHTDSITDWLAADTPWRARLAARFPASLARLGRA